MDSTFYLKDISIGEHLLFCEKPTLKVYGDAWGDTWYPIKNAYVKKVGVELITCDVHLDGYDCPLIFDFCKKSGVCIGGIQYGFVAYEADISCEKKLLERTHRFFMFEVVRLRKRQNDLRQSDNKRAVMDELSDNAKKITWLLKELNES